MTPTKRYIRDTKLDELEQSELRIIRDGLLSIGRQLDRLINTSFDKGYVRDITLATLYNARENCHKEKDHLGQVLKAYRSRTR